MRISDWSSDVCSSDLHGQQRHSVHVHPAPICRPSLDDCSRKKRRAPTVYRRFSLVRRLTRRPAPESAEARATGGAAGARGGDRKSVVKGKSGSVRVDNGGGLNIKNKNKQ